MFYWIMRFLVFTATRFVYRLKISGAENIPADGAFILCSNHIHSFDPAMLVVASKRRMRFMAKKEIFSNPIKGYLFRLMGAFPVDRQAADLTSYRNAMNVLKSGGGLLIFSQGTRMQQLDIKGAKGGVALFGVKAQVPIVPAGISGKYRVFSRLNVCVGKPIYLEEYYGARLQSEQIDEIMTVIMHEVEKLVS